MNPRIVIVLAIPESSNMLLGFSVISPIYFQHLEGLFSKFLNF